MRKPALLLLSGLLVTGALLFSCEKKKPSEGIAPTFGTSGNPNPGYQTVTGTTTYTNPATQNTGIQVGGPGWTNPTCGSTHSLTLKGTNGQADVTLSFATIIKTGTYNIASSPGSNMCAMTIVNAPDQPAGIVWYGKTGVVTVNTNSATINANFSNIVCTQQNFSFPTVSASGALSCGQ